MFRQLIGKRQAGRELIGHILHGCRVIIGIGTQTERSRKAFVYRSIVDRSEKSPAHDVQIGVIVKCLRMVGVHLLESGVAILAIVQIGSDSHFPVAERRAVFQTELSVLLRRTETEREVVRITFVVLPVFGVPVVQITVAGDDRLYVCPCIMPVYSAKCECLLLNLRQVTEYIFIIFIVGFGV